jgi:diguanylate cyclase (GGDEF)-like protein
MRLGKNTENSGRRWGRTSAAWVILALIAASCAALIALETTRVIGQRQQILAEATNDNANLADSLIQHAELTVRVADALMVGAVERIELDGLGPENRARLSTWFQLEASRSTQFYGFAVIGSDGELLVGSHNGETKPNYSDREYFIYHQTHADRELRIGAPIKGRANAEWQIPVTRRFDRPDGSFGGVAIAAIRTKYFQDFYDRLEIGNNGTIRLASMSGKLLIRRPYAEADFGRDVSQNRIFSLLKQSPAGSAELVSTTDGITRLNSYKQGQSYPLFIAVGKDKAELLAEWHRLAVRQLGETAGIALLISLVGGFAWWTTKRLAGNAANLHATNDRFEAAINSMSQGFCLYGSNKRVIVANAKYAEIYRLSPDQVRPGTHVDDIFRYRIERGTSFQPGPDLFNSSNSEDVHEIKDLADGRILAIVRHIMPDGGILSIHEDITVRANNERKIAYLAEHDQLTGLPNRHHFSRFLSDAAAKGNRASDRIAVFMLDLDRFKAVNDTLGHAAGDQLLSMVADRLKACGRANDFVARLGGDEFAIIQFTLGNGREAAIALALRIIDAIAEPFELDGQLANIGTSVGIALCPEHGRLPADLMRNADLALYAAKAAGKNDFRMYDVGMSVSDHEQKELDQELREALQRDEFELHYQPVVELATGKIRGAEALVRWRHPTRGLIPPDRFIPLAESSGLIIPLGEWILQKACSDAASWQPPIKVAVNISAIQFTKGDMLDVVLCTLVETGLSPSRLELELTETALLDEGSNHAQTIRQLRNVGITLVMDDFGTGYSSASTLTNFAFGKIKLDKSFVQGMATRRECAAVVASILALAKGLGVETTAEGVETSEQMEMLRAAGVTYGQGYYFGRPAPGLPADFAALPLRQTA